MKNRSIFSIFTPPPPLPRPSVCDCRYSAAQETFVHHLHAKTQRKSFALLAVILLYWQVKTIQITVIYIVKVTNRLFYFVSPRQQMCAEKFLNQDSAFLFHTNSELEWLWLWKRCRDVPTRLGPKVNNNM